MNENKVSNLFDQDQLNAINALKDLDVSVLSLDESDLVSAAAASSGSGSSGISTCGSSSCCA